MPATVTPFGVTKKGQPVCAIRLENGYGTAVTLLTYGATIQSFIFDGTDIVLGYDDLSGYENANGSYLGATIGRVANRISGGRFPFQGRVIHLAGNEDGANHLHGGTEGFDKKVWDYDLLSTEDCPAVRFTCVSEDGEEGYPGRLSVSVIFTLQMNNTLEIAYSARSDKDTVINLTNHSYFNLNGCDGSLVLDTLLKVDAAAYTPVDRLLNPSGEIALVAGTPLDFRQYKALGEVIEAPHPVLQAVGGIDHNFVLDTDVHPMREVAWAYSPVSGLRLTCSTDRPGLQVYTANFLDEERGKNGHPLKRYQAFCLETQFFPDSVNRPEFPSVLLRAGELYETTTCYRVDKPMNE